MRVIISISLVILTTLMSCDTSKKTIAMNKENQDITGSYTVLTMHNIDAMTIAPQFSFYAKDNSFRGNTGCNSVFGSFSSEGQEIVLNDLAVSEMYCDGEGIMEIERAFLNILKNIGSYKLTEETLIFYAKDTNEVLLEASIGITK